MSGCSWEYVMGVMEDSLNSNKPISQVVNLDNRFYDIYTYGISYNAVPNLGDALKEVATWNSDYDVFVVPTIPWLARGGGPSGGINSGIFSFGIHYGTAHNDYSTRAVLR